MSNMNLPAPDPMLETQFQQRHDRAFAYLKGLLLDGGLEPNDLISTEEVGRALGISRAPVTDAIKRLVRDGFMIVLPQVGCRICEPLAEDVDDFYHLFAKSEALITRMAAERRTPGPIAAFTALTAQIDAQLRNNLPGADARALNRQRYEAIHAMADSKITGDLVANMWDRSDFYIRIAYGSFRFSSAVQASNTKIARAIIDGDADTAAQVTEAYLLRVGVSTAATLAAHGR